MRKTISTSSGLWLASRARLALAGAMVAGAVAASAGEYCVTCESPSAQYRCAIAAGTGTGGAVTPTDSRAQLLCVSELARKGGHERCAVSRMVAGGCAGELRTVSPPEASGSAPLGLSTPATALAAPAGAEPHAPVEAKAASPPATNTARPKTVEDLAKDTVASSADGLKQAGTAVSKGAGTIAEGAKSAGGTVSGSVSSASQAVGSMAKKSWECLASLFKRC